MQRSTWIIGVLALVAGCASGPGVTTYSEAFADRDKVFDTTLEVIDRYAFIREQNRKSGRIVGEVKPDNQFFTKSRKVIYGEIYDRGGYHDVEVRVVYQVDASEADVLRDAYVQPYEWQHLSYDQFLETRLLNEIKNRITGGAFDTKEPLLPETAPAPAEAEATATGPDPYATIRRALAEKRVTIDFDDTAFEEVIHFLAEASGLNIVLDPDVLDLVGDEKVTVQLTDVVLGNALQIVLDLASPRLVMGFRHGVLYIDARAARHDATDGGSI